MPTQVIAASVNGIIGKSEGKTILDYGGGGSGPARAGDKAFWDDEDDDSSWDNL